jgi:hypothetical protein
MSGEERGKTPRVGEGRSRMHGPVRAVADVLLSECRLRHEVPMNMTDDERIGIRLYYSWV